MSTRKIPGGKRSRGVRLTTSPRSCAECHEILEPNLLERSGSHRVCYGNPLFLITYSEWVCVVLGLKLNFYEFNSISTHVSNFLCGGKAVNNPYSEWVWPTLSSMQCARSVLYFHLCLLPIPYFSTLSHKRHDFREKVIEHKMWFGFLYNFRLKHFSI
jgi:hypothetical protein